MRKTKILEQALLLARKEKNERLMGEVAAAWFALVPRKGLEIWDRWRAGIFASSPPPHGPGQTVLCQGRDERLLDQAADEAREC